MEKRITVLVVDDEKLLLELYRRMFEPEGYRVLLVDNATAALDLFNKQRPDIVILDIKMPGMNGYEMLARLRQSSDVPVIMVTAVNEPKAISESLGLGADDFLRKPFSRVELLARVRAKLRRSGTKD
jgi:two-component system, OmpR family, response regulator AdeR